MFMFVATIASAQGSGGGSGQGSDPPVFFLTSAANGTLSANWDFGSVTPTNTSTLVTRNVTMRLRSNAAYKLTAVAGALQFTGAATNDGGDALTLSDIGFGVTATTLTGANVANTGSRDDEITEGFNYTSGFPSITNGKTPFLGAADASHTGNLNDITGGGLQILKGGRVSADGDLSSTDNFITVTVSLALLPQFFTPNTTFSSALTLTIAAQ
jgi:hypothetical protein